MQFNYTDIIDAILYDEEPQAKQILEKKIEPVLLSVIKKNFSSEEDISKALNKSFEYIYDRLDEIEDKRDFEAWAENICEIACVDVKRSSREALKENNAQQNKKSRLPIVLVIIIILAVAAVSLFLILKNNSSDKGGTDENSSQSSETVAPDKEYAAIEYLFGTDGAQIDYSKAKKAFLADKEDPQNLYYLGYMYETGCGVAIDMDKAIKNYLEAYELGNVDAGVRLGFINLYGVGMDADTEKAATYFNNAYNVGNAGGAYGLAIISLYGLDTEINITAATGYFNECFEADMEQTLKAQLWNDVGYCIALGVGYEEDKDLAAQYFEEAFKAGYFSAGGNLGNLTDVIEDDSVIYDAALKAAKAGNAQAQAVVGTFLSKGFTVSKDETAALEYYEESAKNGDGEGLTKLAKIYAAGRLVTRDEEEATALFEQAISLGNNEALLDLGIIQRFLHSDDDDIKKAGKKKMKLAALNGYTTAMVESGKIQRSYKDSRDKALENFKKASTLGNAEAVQCVETFDEYVAGTIDNDFREIGVLTRIVYEVEPRALTLDEIKDGNSGGTVSEKGFNDSPSIACTGKLGFSGEGTVEEYIISEEMIGFKINIDVTDYTAVTFYVKGKNGGTPIVLVCNEKGEVLQEYTSSSDDVKNSWTAKKADVSSIEGEVTLIFCGGGYGSAASEESSISYSDIVLY